MAGVVGSKSYSYHLFGDTVNTGVNPSSAHLPQSFILIKYPGLIEIWCPRVSICALDVSYLLSVSNVLALAPRSNTSHKRNQTRVGSAEPRYARGAPELPHSTVLWRYNLGARRWCSRCSLTHTSSASIHVLVGLRNVCGIGPRGGGREGQGVSAF